MDLGLDGRVAIVTGASKGLGLGAARALAAEGVKLVLGARDADRLQAAASELPTETITVTADVAAADTATRLAEAAAERFGGLHILVANAGGPPPVRALDVDGDAMHAAVESNMLGSIRLVQACVPHMRAAGWGRICLLTSYAVKQPIPTLAYSNAARTGLWAWAKTAAQDLIDDGITLNLTCPGPHATDRAIELGLTGPMGDPGDFGKVVAFLCSQPAGFVSGAALQVDGAATVGLL
jgi:3-oxoacyl-[acyl-carrier protein] reductase